MGIKNGDWDAVVLQDQSQRPNFGAQYVYNNIIPNVLTLVQTMRETNACTLPVFFQTWGKRDGDTGNCGPAPYDALCTFEGVQDQLTEAYNTMAYVAQPSKVAPAGEAWRTFPNRNSLFSHDGSHASCHGTFLAASTIFRQIWGVAASSSTYTYPSISAMEPSLQPPPSSGKSGEWQPHPAPTPTPPSLPWNLPCSLHHLPANLGSGSLIQHLHLPLHLCRRCWSYEGAGRCHCCCWDLVLAKQWTSMPRMCWTLII